MIELKKEDLRDRLRDVKKRGRAERFVTDEEVDKAWAVAYTDAARMRLLREKQKVAQYGKMYLEKIAKETDTDLAKIEAVYKLQTLDPFQWVYNFVAPNKDEDLEREELQQWYLDARIDNDTLRRENKRLNEEIKALKNAEENEKYTEPYDSDKLMTVEEIKKLSQHIFFVDKDGNRRRVEIKTDTTQT